MKPYVVFGTNMSSSTLVNMEILEKAGIPQFPGSTSPNVTNQGNKNIFPIRVNAENIMLKVKEAADILLPLHEPEFAGLETIPKG